MNNAGIIRPGVLEWQSLEEMRFVMDVNYWGTVSVTKAFLPFLKRRGGGRLINVSSMAGKSLRVYVGSSLFYYGDHYRMKILLTVETLAGETFARIKGHQFCKIFWINSGLLLSQNNWPSNIIRSLII